MRPSGWLVPEQQQPSQVHRLLTLLGFAELFVISIKSHEVETHHTQLLYQKLDLPHTEMSTL